MKRSAVLSAAAVGLLLALALAGCGSGGSATQPTSPGTAATNPTTPSTTPSGSNVQVFLLKGETVYQVSRPDSATGGKAALEELLKGPSAAERAEGLTTAIPAGTRLNSYSVENGTARADFSAELKSYGGGSTMVQAIINQISNTVVNSDPSARTVVISVDGVPAEESLQP